MLWGMLKPKKRPPKGKGRPRTVRLDKEDERWVDAQKHSKGFSGIVNEAVKLYRRIRDEQDNQLVESVR